MGAGRTPAGLFATAGNDPITLVAAATAVAYPRALEFDPGARANPLNPDGTFVDIDPVDQEVTLLLGIEQGSIVSAKSFGNKLRLLLNRVPPSKKNAIATQEVARVLKPLLENGDIRLLSVVVNAVVADRTIIGVTYVNLRIAITDPKNPLASATTKYIR